MTAILRLVAVAACVLVTACATAQDAPGVDQAKQDAATANVPPLKDTQESIRVRYDRFEDTLYKMAQYLQKTEPARAELVMRALSRSKEERVAERMKLASGLLSKGEGKSPQFADAIEEQDAILANLRELLTILRSEDILDENRKEQERLTELARQVSALIDAEKIHQAETQRGEPADRVVKGQERTAGRTGDVIRQIDEHDRAANRDDEKKEGEETGDKESEGKQKGEQSGEEEQKGQKGESGKSQKGQKSEASKGQSGEQKRDDQKPGEEGAESDESEPSDKPDGEQPPSGAQSQQGQKGQQSQQGRQSEQGQQSQQGEQQEGQQQSEQSGGPPKATPGREELEAAREKMERAIEELKKQNRENASKEQEEAIRKLIEAKERIEELLRQLREEERELLLRALEARFQKMLQLQQVVLATTEDLNMLAKEQWQDREFGRCRDAAATEREILLEADKALEVLEADGSSVAFPEAVSGIRTDVQEVATRLGREEAGELTIAIEREIIDALEEMILALQKEMEKIREQKGQQQQGQQGQQGEPGLVDQLAELKMLKTLQLRINRRTKTLGQLFEGEQATEPDVAGQLRELADRQGRLQRATYDLATGRTAN